MILWRIVIAVGMTLSLAVTGTAQTLISKLPEDGVWAEYAFVGKTRSFPDGAPLELNGFLTLRSVGVETIEMEKLRWIEIEVNVDYKGEPVKTVEKLLVSEDDMNAGRTVTECLRKRWKHHSKESTTPQQVDLTSAQGKSLGYFFPETYDEQRSLEPKEIETPAGKWTCTGLANTQRKKDPIAGAPHVKTLTVYSHSDSPFGSVLLTVKNGDFESTEKIGTLTLARTGTNAKSFLPDVK